MPVFVSDLISNATAWVIEIIAAIPDTMGWVGMIFAICCAISAAQHV